MLKLIIASALLATPAFAQQQSPEMEALGAKLIQEINAGVQCNANAVAGRREIERLMSEVKALKAKYEPEKKDAKQE